jgi:preprotein translocase subunit SecY
MFRRILLVLTDAELRLKIIKIVLLLVASRILAHIPIPLFEIKDLSPIIDADQFLGLLNTIAGGSYGKLSFVMLGIGPYITSSIVMQLLGVIIPKLNELRKEGGEAGQQQINRLTRYLTVPVAALNSWGILQFLSNSPTEQKIVSLPEALAGKELTLTSFGWWSVVIISMTCGSIIMMWIGEIINEYKMGNGISLMILAGIAANLPSKLVKVIPVFWANLSLLFEKSLIFKGDFSKVTNWNVWKAFLWENAQWSALRSFFLLIVVFGGTLLLVIFFNDAVRKLVIIYSRRGHTEGKSRTLNSVQADLPIKVNIAGVLPIIFAVSLILFPTILSRFFFTANVQSLRSTAQSVETFLSSNPSDAARNGQTSLNPGSPKNNFLGFYNTNSKEELAVAKTNDFTVGQELLGFTISTNPEVKNEILEGVPFINKVELPSTNLGFLPKGIIRWNGILAYTLFYFILIIFFTYFYTSEIAFKTDEVAENLQKSGAYIPGFKPGKDTADYLQYITNRINVVGAFFLACIALLPIAFQNEFGSKIGDSDGTLTGIVGGTTLLILVSVAIETLKQIDAQATNVDYDRFTKY